MSASLSLGFVNIKAAWLRTCPMWQLRLALFIFPWLPFDFRICSFWACVTFLLFVFSQTYYINVEGGDVFFYALCAVYLSSILLEKHLKRMGEISRRITDYRLKADLVGFSKKTRLMKGNNSNTGLQLMKEKPCR